MATREELEEYRRRLAAFERDTVEYEAKKRDWDSLDVSARTRLNAQAEQGSRAFWGFLLILALAWLAYVALKTRLQGDGLWFAWAGSCVLLLALWLFLHSIIGLLARSAVWAIIGALMGLLATSAFSAVTGQQLSQFATGATACVVGALGLLAGLAPRSAAEPVKPTRPSKPT